MTSQLATLVYHYVRPASELPSAGYSGVDLDAFERQLDDVTRDFTPVEWPAVCDSLHGGPALPGDALLLTFDDGLADHVRYVLPRLAERRLSAIFFPLARSPRDGLALGHRLHVLISRFGSDNARMMIVDGMPASDRERHAALVARALAQRPYDPEDAWKRPLQREMSAAAAPVLAKLIAENIGPEEDLAAALYVDDGDLAKLVDAGMYLGGHGAAHTWLDHEDASGARAEVEASVALLARLQQEPWAFAYPYGGVNDFAAAEVARAGFRAAFTTARVSDGPFRLGRVDGEAVGHGRVRAALWR